jgi:hypothetical protein
MSSASQHVLQMEELELSGTQKWGLTGRPALKWKVGGKIRHPCSLQYIDINSCPLQYQRQYLWM